MKMRQIAKSLDFISYFFIPWAILHLNLILKTKLLSFWCGGSVFHFRNFKIQYNHTVLF